MSEVYEPKPKDNPQTPLQEAVHQETTTPPVRRFRTVLFLGAMIAVVAAFAALALLASTTAYFPLDLTITKTLQSLRSPAMDSLMNFISLFGFLPMAPIIEGFFVLLLLLLGLYWESTMVLLSVTFMQLVNGAVKYLVHRARPPSSLIDVYQVLKDYSFPSGHVMFYVALFGFMLFLTYTLLKRSLLRTVLMILFAAMIVLVGVSRIYLGEHWASDVLAAYLLSSVGLSAAVFVYRWGKPRFFVRQPVAQASKGEVEEAKAKPLPVTGDGKDKKGRG